MLVGAVCLLLAILLAVRIVRAVRDGEVPLYRTRLQRDAVGNARFFGLIGINFILFLAMSVIAVDLLLGLGLRP